MAIRSWDIFCRVIDNYGDIGVSWRLARQLAAEHGARVRLWIDDLAALHAMWPDIDPAMCKQIVASVNVYVWDDNNFSDVQPAAVVIEAFGCGLPEAYVQRIVDTSPLTLWIILEYLSAESWVAEHHGLPSPHPRLPVRRYFFFPGFAQGSGGVLREADLFVQRDAFGATAVPAFWQTLGFEPPSEEGAVVSLFAYEHAPLEELLTVWADDTKPTVAVIPQGALAGRAARFVGASKAIPAKTLRRSGLEIRFTPFLSQPMYDRLLWVSDFNFVRGEDSFVRAQWAGRPFVWQAYSQVERAHWAKLDAFLKRYSEYLSEDAARSVSNFWLAWNRVGDPPPSIEESWHAFRRQSGTQKLGLAEWNRQLVDIGDLAANLASFCQNNV